MLLGVSAIIAAITVYVLYVISFENTKKELMFDYRTQTALIESVGKFNGIYGKKGIVDAKKRDETLMQFRTAFEKLENIEGHFEFVIAEKRFDGLIHYVALSDPKHRQEYTIRPGEERGQPMQLALQKRSGIVEAFDYKGNKVLAAYGYLNLLDVGLVVKIDLKDLQKPYIIAGEIVFIVYFVMMVLSMLLLRRINAPVLDKAIETQVSLSSLFNHNTLPLLLLKNDMETIVDANESFYAVSGYDPNVLKTIPFSDLMRGSEYAIILQKMKSEIEYPSLSHDRFHLFCESGIEIPVLLLFSRIPIDGNEQYIVTIFDQRAAVKLEQERREEQALINQQSRLASMGEMIGAIAHQWRQPLNAVGLLVQSIAYLAKSGKEYGNKIDHQVEQVMGQLEYMSQTIDDFRRFFSPDIEKVVIDPASVIAKTVMMLYSQLQNHSIWIGMKNGDNVIMVENRETCMNIVVCPAMSRNIVGYPSELRQVMINIMQNSRDAIMARQKHDIEFNEGKITIECLEEDGSFMIRLCDNGGGIPADVLPKIFEPYFTTKPEGTGIGLYIVYKIITERFNGYVKIVNREDGVCMTVILPYAAAVET